MPHARAQIRVLVFHASLRDGSHNDKLATLASQCMERLGATIERASMADFDCPSYDFDVENEAAISQPPTVDFNKPAPAGGQPPAAPQPAQKQ